MKKFFFVFGFEHPTDRAMNEDFGDEFYSSSEFWIDASNPDAALEFGRKLAIRFISALYTARRIEVSEQIITENLVTWLEDEPRDLDRNYDIDSAPVFEVGAVPEMSEWAAQWEARIRRSF